VTDPTADTLYTPRSLARKIRADATAAGGPSPIGEDTIRRLIASGELPAADLGRGCVIRWSDLLELLERRARARRPSPPRRSRADRTDRAVRAAIARERRTGR
jgi:excisionase family DNA binding protein